MKRNHWLAFLTLLLLVGYVSWYFWNNWGLITVHAAEKPLGDVIRSIEKQGHVTIRTNMDLTKPVTMEVEKVVLAEALETLAVSSEARWRLTYLVAPDKGAIDAALATISAGERPEGWDTKYVPTMGMNNDDVLVLPDPRKDRWEVTEAKEANLQAYLEQASRHVSASFLVLESFNPAVPKAPSAGAVSKSLPKLVSTAKGSYKEIFLLQGDRRRERAEGEGRPPGDDDGPRFAGNFGDGGGRRGGFNREAMEERVQNEINKMPTAQRETAQKEYNERKQFFEDLRTLPPEQQREKMQEFMSDPKNMERMENAMAAREARRSPESRAQRGQKYRQRKQQASNRQ